MADAKAYCGHCGKDTDHTYMTGKSGVCVICGESHELPDWNKVKAAVEKRMAAAQVELASRTVLTTSDLEARKETPAPARMPAPAEPPAVVRTETIAEKNNTKEKHMAKRLTQEQIIEVQNKFAERVANGEGRVEACAALAKEYNVSAWTIRDKAGVTGPMKPAKKTPPAAKGAGDKAAAPARHQEPAVGSLREELARLIDERVDVKMASIGLENFDARVEAALARILAK